MPDSITWRLGADASQVRAEMAAAQQAVSGGTKGLIRDLEGVTTTHEALLRSDHRVAGSMRMLTREAMTASSGFEALGSAFESFAMATNVSLPALIGLEVVGTLIGKIAKAHEEAVKLDKELSAAGGPRDTKLSVEEDIRKRREVIERAQKDIEAKSQPPWYARLGNSIVDFMRGSGGAIYGARGTGMNREGFERPDQIPASATYDRSWSQLMAVRKTDLEIEQEKLKAAEAAADAIKKQADEEEKLAAAAKHVQGEMQYSLEDIAKEGLHKRDKRGRFDSDDVYYGDLAEKALAEQKESRRLRMLGPAYFAQASQHQQTAEAIKNQIVPLKDTEKDFLSAIERADVFKKIEQNTARMTFDRK